MRRGTGKELEPVTLSYTCPMHPKVVERDASVPCPDCGMKLEPKVEPLRGTGKEGHGHGEKKDHDHK